MAAKRSLSYADAGVNIPVWNAARKRIGRLVESTFNKNVVGKFGHFGGMFSLASLKNYKNPILVSSVDGVGTKLAIAAETGIHNTVGMDIVNHCINDILVLGAKPLYFLDYIATGKLDSDVFVKILDGLTRACKAADCVLIGGETAEMPGMYREGEYDIAGTIVGVVDEKDVIDGSDIRKGDTLIGLRSNGLHTNGYSLARKIMTVARKKYSDILPETGHSFGEEFLRPHRPYSPVLELMEKGQIRGCAHITGGGFTDNVDRILSPKCDAAIDAGSWTPDPIFTWMQKAGKVENREMYRTFNMGIGMVLVVKPSDADKVLKAKAISKFEPRIVGTITAGTGKVNLKF
jgi:phosphoribosylformylglycinamidine cyclo-ligase